jgi:hypothetical protein
VPLSNSTEREKLFFCWYSIRAQIAPRADGATLSYTMKRRLPPVEPLR